MLYTIVKNEEEAFLTVFLDDRNPLVVKSDNPDYEQILLKVVQGDESAIDLIDKAAAAAERFENLSERVTVKDGVIYFDNDPVDNALTKVIIRFLSEGVKGWEPLVKFMEKVYTNPIDHSREQLFTFLNANGMDISIAEDGDIIAYKGMRRDEDDEGAYYQPTHNGHIIVDGEDFPSSDNAKQRVGSVVEMPRSEVRHNPNVSCDAGLHIATFRFAKTYGTVVEVRVNPRDVVSVPNHESQKVRACRYTIVGEVTEQYKQVLVADEAPEESATLSYNTSVRPAVEEDVEIDLGDRFGGGWVHISERVPEAGADIEGWSSEDFDYDDTLFDTPDHVEEFGPKDITVTHATKTYAEGYVEGDEGVVWCFDYYKYPESVQQVEERQATVSEPSPVVVEGRIPTAHEFQAMIDLARGQKKGIKAVAPTRGWKQVGDLPKQPASWRIP